MINIISISISGLSLLLSALTFLYSWLTNRDKITIKWHNKMHHLGNPAIIFDNYTTIPPAFTKVPNPRKAYLTAYEHDPYLAQITIVNYGNNDIGYFGLKALDQNNNSYPVLTKDYIQKTYGLRYVLKMTNKNRNGIEWHSIPIPKNNYGILKAHSYQIWNIIIDGNFNKINKLFFQLGLTKKHWYSSSKSNSFKGKNKFYCNSSIINNISNRYNHK